MGQPQSIFELDLVAIGKRQRHVFWCLMAWLLIVWSVIMTEVLWANVSYLFPLDSLANITAIAVVIASVVCVVRLQAAFGIGVLGLIVYAIATVLLSFLVLLVIFSQASMVLRLAGAKVGMMGASDSELAKLAPGNCRGCGYSRDGLETLQQCPECNRVPLVI